MKLSIITVNLNNKEGLKRTISSVIGQTFKDYEYIIIDGGSVDGSKEVIESHLGGINFWVSEPDTGIYSAMNKGWKVARGEYLLFLNSGDYLYTESVLQDFSNLYAVSDFYCGNVLFEKELGVRFQKDFPDEISLKTFVQGSLPHQGMFIKRDLFVTLGGYDESFDMVSDWKFCMESLVKLGASFEVVDFFVSVYDANGISSTNDQKYHIEMQRARLSFFTQEIWDVLFLFYGSYLIKLTTKIVRAKAWLINRVKQ